MKKYIRSLLSVALSLSVLLSVSLYALAAPKDTRFTDVAPGIWYADAVTYCRKNNLMNGTADALFSPDDTMSRATLVTVLYRLSGGPAAAWVNPFSDVAADAWYHDAVVWAFHENLVDGYGDAQFGPNDPVSREQFAAILWRKAGEPWPQTEILSFSDRSELSNWSFRAVLWAMETGLFNGKPQNRFDPQGNATRAEAAVILQRYHAAPIPSPSPSPTPTPTPTTVLPNTYDSERFFVQGGFLHYGDEGASRVGIDVSSYQGKIDWAKVAAAGVDFAIIRGGYRGYTVGTILQDAYFKQNIEGALAAGLDVGAYIFSQATTVQEAKEEALQLLAWTKGYDITYPLVFDWERVSQSGSRTQTTSGSVITSCAKAFCDTISAAGYTPMVYGNPSMVYASELNLSALRGIPFWLAHYTSGWAPTSFRYHYHMWQYTSTGRVDGISGNVDLNISFLAF
ncbi:MAG: GH25 family lysozyme [Oscillospiraceae bacterium]